MKPDTFLALIRTTFLAADNRLRAVWRALLYAPLYLILVQPLFWLVWAATQGTGVRGQMEGRFLLWAVASCLAQLVLVKLMLQWLDRRRFGTLGLRFYRRWLKELAVGIGLGAVMVSIVVGVEAAWGAVRFTWMAGASHGLFGLPWNMGLFLAGALKEELQLRGYPFQRAIEAIGAWPAVAICSVIFGALHWWNPAATLLSTVNTVLIGALIAIAYLKTRGLWLPIGMHFAWNFFLGYVYSLPVSGIVLHYRLLRAQVTGPTYLTGGDYGPEASVVTAAVIVVVAVWLWRTKKISVSQEMAQILE